MTPEETSTDEHIQSRIEEADEAEAPNFCARCGKRLGAGIHTCSLPREDGAAVEGLTALAYALCEAVQDTHQGETEFDRGMRTAAKHIARALLAASPVPMASSAGEPLPTESDALSWIELESESRVRHTIPAARSAGEPVAETWWLKELQEFWETSESELTAAVKMAINYVHANPPAASLREQEPLSDEQLEKVYSTLDGGKRGYPMLWSIKHLARAIEKAHGIDAQRLGRGKENGNG